ncbi:MAG: lipid-A-disaccharide synthase [SAR324 cluster bacterium]|nr:lipid-A-disaccharide synthase [SAR324 cluster bacterium]
MKILIVAGEASGDFHGAALIRELKNIFPSLTTYGIGGPLMLREGLNAYYTLDSLRVHGLVELIPHLPRLYRILWHLRDSLLEEQPDLAIFIDYPGFNLKMAVYVKKLNIPVIWYSSPQVWAWRAGRIHQIAKVVDKIFVLFPFEEKIYRKIGMDVSFVGHPRLEDNVTSTQITHFKHKYQLEDEKTIIVLAIGSRPSELKRHMPIVLEALSLLQSEGIEAHYVMPVAEGLELKEFESKLLSSPVPILLCQGSFLESIHAADIAVVASGTATLQVGLALTPFVIIYKVAPSTYWIAKKLAKIPYIGIVNILARRFIVPELIQKEFTPKNLVCEIMRLLNDASYVQQMIKDLKTIRRELGEPGAYRRTAQKIQEFAAKHTQDSES